MKNTYFYEFRSVFLVLIFFLVSHETVFSQPEILSLQQAVNLVEKNEINHAKQVYFIQEIETHRTFHKFSLLPTASASTSLNTNFGRRVDPFTNTFATNQVLSQSFGLSSNVTLFNGFLYFHNREKINLQFQSSKIDLNTLKNSLLTDLIETYVSLCKQEIQLNLSKLRIEKLNEIQAIQRILIDSKRISTLDSLRSYQSILVEEAALLKIQTEYKRNLYQLNFLIGYPLTTVHRFDLQSISKSTCSLFVTDYFNLEKKENELKQLKIDLKIAQTSILPTFSVNGNVGTGFSTNNKDFSLPNTPTKTYGEQINQNLYESVGFYLNIPIFNRGEWLKTTKINQIQQHASQAELDQIQKRIEIQKLELENNKLEKSASISQLEKMVSNLNLLYKNVLLLYQEGRITYTEVENTFLELQQKQIELEIEKLELQRLSLF
jgi:outer membrane protein